MEKGIVSADDSYILLAINCRQIPHAQCGSVIPYVVQTFLPFGNAAVTFDVRTGKS